MWTDTELCRLSRKYACDKGGQHQLAGDICHNYTPVYWDMWEKRRNEVLSILEIGVNTGASLRMWSDFFPNSVILGLDNNPNCIINERGGRIRSKLADQGSPDSLRAAVDGQTFDFIVDDGSHIPVHQIISMHTLLPYLRPHGLYVVEDLTEPGETMVHTVPSGFAHHIIKCPGNLGPTVFREELLVVTHA